MSKSKEKNNKIYLVFVALLLIAAGVFFINMIHTNKPAGYSDKTVKINLSAISTFNYSKVSTIEEKIRALDDYTANSTITAKTKLTNAQYNKIFSSSVIIGDSLTEGISDYGYLSSSKVFCKIGASVMYGDDLFSSAAATYPKFAFLSFGMNDMGNYTGHADMFISKYKKLILEFKKTSPDTKIFINNISTPTPGAIAGNSSIGNYQKFNDALQIMCKELHLKYIDNSFILAEHPDYYSGDGIHVVSAYYPLWLNNMIMKAGL